MGTLTYDAWAQPFLYPVSFELQVSSGSVESLRVRFGYGHRSAEALLARSPVALPAVLSQVCGQHSVGLSWAVFRALEELAGEAVPFSVECLRSIALELERTVHHLSVLRNLAVALGWQGGMGLTQQAMALARDVVSTFGGMPLGRHFGFGGYFVPDLDSEKLVSLLIRLQASVNRLTDLWVHNPSVGERLIGLARITAAQASELGLVGPVARASGVNCDIRLLDPYGAYQEVAPRAQSQGAGDAYARMVVIAGEILDSVTLAIHLVGQLGAHRPPISSQLRLVPGVRAARVEGADGEVVAIVAVEKGPMLEAIHIRPGSAANVAGMSVALEGVPLQDWTLAYLSMTICSTCVDR